MAVFYNHHTEVLKIISSYEQVLTDSSTLLSKEPNDFNKICTCKKKNILLSFPESHKIKLQPTEGHRAHR